MIILIKRVFKTIKTVECEKELLNKEYEILKEKNLKRSTDIRNNISEKSKEFASKKELRSKHYNIIRNK